MASKILQAQEPIQPLLKHTGTDGMPVSHPAPGFQGRSFMMTAQRPGASKQLQGYSMSNPEKKIRHAPEYDENLSYSDMAMRRFGHLMETQDKDIGEIQFMKF